MNIALFVVMTYILTLIIALMVSGIIFLIGHVLKGMQGEDKEEPG